MADLKVKRASARRGLSGRRQPPITSAAPTVLHYARGNDPRWFMHDHPSYDPSPSKADIEMTREVARADAGGAKAPQIALTLSRRSRKADTIFP